MLNYFTFKFMVDFYNIKMHLRMLNSFMLAYLQMEFNFQRLDLLEA